MFIICLINTLINILLNNLFHLMQIIISEKVQFNKLNICTTQLYKMFYIIKLMPSKIPIEIIVLKIDRIIIVWFIHIRYNCSSCSIVHHSNRCSTCNRFFKINQLSKKSRIWPDAGSAASDMLECFPQRHITIFD